MSKRSKRDAADDIDVAAQSYGVHGVGADADRDRVNVGAHRGSAAERLAFVGIEQARAGNTGPCVTRGTRRFAAAFDAGDQGVLQKAGVEVKCSIELIVEKRFEAVDRNLIARDVDVFKRRFFGDGGGNFALR